jgi:hypothetical protein
LFPREWVGIRGARAPQLHCGPSANGGISAGLASTEPPHLAFSFPDTRFNPMFTDPDAVDARIRAWFPTPVETTVQIHWYRKGSSQMSVYGGIQP